MANVFVLTKNRLGVPYLRTGDGPFEQSMCTWLEAAGAALARGMYPIPAATSPQITTARATYENLDLRKVIHYLLEALE